MEKYYEEYRKEMKRLYYKKRIAELKQQLSSDPYNYWLMTKIDYAEHCLLLYL